MIRGSFIVLLTLSSASENQESHRWHSVSYQDSSVSASAFCPTAKPSKVVQPCYYSTVILLDVSSDVTSDFISKEFSFISSEVLPGLYYVEGQEVAVVTYGATESSEPLTSNYSTACEESDVARQDALRHGGRNMTLTQAITTFFRFYGDNVQSVILFSNCQDRNDIISAGQYVVSHSAHFTVVAFGGNIDVWKSSFYAYKVYPGVPWVSSSPSDWGNCLVGRTCNETPAISVPTIPSKTELTTTTIRTTTSGVATRTTPRPESDNGPQCVCQPKTAWVDIMLIFDASSYNGKEGLLELLDYSTLFSDLNLQKSWSGVQQSSRIGIITYSDRAYLVYPLGSIDNMDNITTLPYSGRNGTNIADAILLAEAQLTTSASRRNARKMIVVLAAGYFPGEYDDPHIAAYQFKNSSGVLAVYNDLGTRTPRDKSQTLEEIASKGYYYTNIQDNANTMINYVCDANCFCPPISSPSSTQRLTIRWQAHKVDRAFRGLSDNGQKGCYRNVETQVNEAVAVRGCERDGSYVAMEKNKEKDEFIASSFPANKKFWVGITWDTIKRTWVWTDGTVVSGSYQPWMTSSVHSDPNNCVYGISIGGQVRWQQYDCRQRDVSYSCERRACDSANYCDIDMF